ncbi:MAG: hypothetical protein H6Q32_1166, partial [Bacteroidetes bacterium]|nr:hypothetical protein [Bacteroidota bacterium]
RQILAALQNLRGGSGTAAGRSLHLVAERIRRRGLVIILSDLFDDPDQVLAAFKHFRHKKNEVIVMQVLDPLERSFAFGEDATFEDLETQERMVTQPWHVRRAYAESMKAFVERYKRECREHQIDYVLLDTHTPFDVALMEYLSKRQRLH